LVLARTAGYYFADLCPWSLQDGADAGQSVPHVHVHIIPRRSTDFDGINDRVYPALEKSEQGLAKSLDSSLLKVDQSEWKVPDDQNRSARSEVEMEKEARWLSDWFKQQEASNSSSSEIP